MAPALLITNIKMIFVYNSDNKYCTHFIKNARLSVKTQIERSVQWPRLILDSSFKGLRQVSTKKNYLYYFQIFLERVPFKTMQTFKNVHALIWHNSVYVDGSFIPADGSKTTLSDDAALQNLKNNPPPLKWPHYVRLKKTDLRLQQIYWV